MKNNVGNNPSYPNIEESQRLFKKARQLIPAETQTLAKGPSQHVFGTMPIFAKSGKGARLWDVDGNEYLDYQMAIGPLSLGYAFPEVDAAIVAQLRDGITFSLPHVLEVEVAEALNRVIPNAEMVRFSKTGADVTSAAIRVARAFTKRSKVLCCGYHGWHDWYIGVTDRAQGIPEAIKDLSFTVNYNDLDQLRDSLDADTACVIMEPMVFADPQPGYLQQVQKLCQENGSLLIFDEMWTGFRLGLGGAQEHFGIKPDLATYSKAIANGMPLSVITGRRDVMRLLEKDVFFFTTFGGEALSLAAAKATLGILENKRVPQYLNKLGTILKGNLQKLIQELDMNFVSVLGYPARTIVNFADAKNGTAGLVMKSYVQQEFAKRGILWGGFHNLSYSHTETDVAYTLEAYRSVLMEMREHVVRGDLREKLRGPVLEPVFRRTSNFNLKPRTK